MRLFFSTHVSKYLVGTLGKYSYILVKGSLNYTNFARTVKLHIKCYEVSYTKCVPRSGRGAQSAYPGIFQTSPLP